MPCSSKTVVLNTYQLLHPAVASDRYWPKAEISFLSPDSGDVTSIELTFHEMVIEFPAKDDARINCTAVSVSRSTITDGDEVAETREVVSKLQKLKVSGCSQNSDSRN